MEWSAARKHAARHTEKESTTADIDVIFATAFCANGHLADERALKVDTTKSNIQDWPTELTGVPPPPSSGNMSLACHILGVL